MYRFLLFPSAGKHEEELTAQVAQLRKELKEFAEANAANGKPTEELTAQIAQLRGELEEESSRVAQLRGMFEEDQSRGFWRRLFGPRSQQASLGLLQQQWENSDSARERARQEMEITREQTRGRIAYALIFTLVGVVLATIAYIAVLSGFGVLDTQEVINVVHGLGTTLLAPIIGLIGAVIGFYYGGQAAVQGTEQARQAATETASHVATQAADQAADKSARAATDITKQATEEATEAARQAARQAGQAAQAAQAVVDNHQPENTNG